MRIQPKNWSEFQHYKDRSPAWIKLHKKILDDYEYHCLPIASRALAPVLWLLASEYDEGMIDAPVEKLCFRLRMTEEDFYKSVEPLVSSGFFDMYRDASKTLAEGKPDAPLEEKRREEEYKPEKEEEKNIPSSGDEDISNDVWISRKKRKLTGKRLETFQQFWTAFDYKTGRAEAIDAWLDIPELTDRLISVIVEAATNEAILRSSTIKSGKTPKMAQGWLTARRWEDEKGDPSNDNKNRTAWEESFLAGDEAP